MKLEMYNRAYSIPLSVRLWPDCATLEADYAIRYRRDLCRAGGYVVAAICEYKGAVRHAVRYMDQTTSDSVLVTRSRPHAAKANTFRRLHSAPWTQCSVGCSTWYAKRLN